MCQGMPILDWSTESGQKTDGCLGRKTEVKNLETRKLGFFFDKNLTILWSLDDLHPR